MRSKAKINEMLVWRLIDMIKGLCNEMQDPHGKARNLDYYPFIPFSQPSLLVELFSQARKYLWAKGIHKPKFLDVGCGPGTIVVLADTIGFNAYGIDYMGKYVKIAKAAMREAYFYETNRENIIKADALNFKRYDQFHVIYYYRPIADSKIMHELYKKIMKDMKIGSLFIPMNFGHPAHHLPKAFKQIDKPGCIVEKIGRVTGEEKIA
jgi:2-polyprenyl-3-methyl-5-hydroxy-6-metoxy-1,4-benzoquinol methylase